MEERPTGVRWIVLAWLCTGGSIAYIHRNCISIPAAQIQKELSLSTEQMGWVMGSFFFSYALLQVPAAWLGTRWGSRVALSVYMGAWSLATAWMGLAGGYRSLTTSRLFNGAFQAGLLPCSAASVRQWFSMSQRSFPTGMLGSFQSVGAMAATLLTSLLLLYLDWRTTFICLSLIGGFWAAGFYWWFRDTPEEHPAVRLSELVAIRDGDAVTRSDGRASGQSAEVVAEESPLAPFIAMLSSSTMLLICGQQFFRAAGYVFFGTWFPRYLQETRDVEVVKSGLLTTLPVLGVAMGSAFGGALVDWIHSRTGNPRLSRQAVATSCMSACGVCTLAAYFIANPTQATMLIAFGSLFAGLGGPAGLTLTIDLGGRHVATAFAVMNMSGNIGAFICPIFVAWFVTRTGQWNGVLFIFAGVYAAATVCWLLLNPHRPIFPREASR